MTRDLILHVGISKTGSTSIQKLLAANRPALTAQGVCYPVSPGNVQHRLLVYEAIGADAAEARGNAPMWNGMTPAERMARFRHEFDNEIKSLPPLVSRVILSSEHLGLECTTPQSLNQLHAFLAPYFSRMRVLVYLRRQDAHFTSNYTQSLRAGDLVPPPTHITLRPKGRDELTYDVFLARWADAFGSDAIMPRLFERTGEQRFDVIDDFLTCCDIHFNEKELAAAGERNQSITQPGQQLLLDLGKRLVRAGHKSLGENMHWGILVPALSEALSGRGWRPARAAAELFYRSFDAANEAARAKWFPTRATLFSEDFSDYPETATPPQTMELYDAACTLAIELLNRLSKQQLLQAKANAANAAQQENPAKLRKALTLLIERDRTDVGARVKLARLYLQEGDWRTAQALANAALILAPDNKGVLHLQKDVTKASRIKA
jgi:tetratricopeptide (TPR) repeat protein